MSVLPKNAWLIAIVGVVVIALGLYAASQQSDTGGNFVLVEQRDITQEVNITGKVQPTESVNLAFEKGGRVSGVFADIGDSAISGDVLASLDTSSLQADLLQASAAVKVEEAKLAELKKGTRSEELQVSETKVANAKSTVVNTKNAFLNVLADAFTKSDDAIRNKVDQFFTAPRSSTPQLNFNVNDSQLRLKLESGRVVVESLLVSWETGVQGAPFTNGLASTTRENLEAIKNYLDSAALAVNALTATGNLTQTTIDGWKSAVSTARANVNTAITNFLGAQEAYDSAITAQTLAENELSLLQAGATVEQIAAQEAALDKAHSTVLGVQAELAKARLVAPFSGVVTKQDLKVGEIVTAGAAVVSLISKGSYEITANVPEADIAKIVLGADARITLDAYSDDDVFYANVVHIDPSETLIDGVSTYGVTLEFLEEDARIRSGMTADIDIVTGERQGVPSLPFRNIRTEGIERVVYVLTGSGERERRVVKTGLRGSDGYVEIVSGVFEGERVAVDG